MSSDENFLKLTREHLEKRASQLRDTSIFADLKSVDPYAFQALWYIAQEVVRQREDENWSIEHDDQHARGDLANAAACYAMRAGLAPNDHRHGIGYPPSIWPWEAKWWKPKGINRDLIRAGALIAAEWGRFMRSTINNVPTKDDGK